MDGRWRYDLKRQGRIWAGRTRPGPKRQKGLSRWNISSIGRPERETILIEIKYYAKR
jgi:hypothetical protein